ncbi:MAG: RHS repeat-associated core domain-containing protein [Candidatus Aminicenantes bacterium]|nr:RHS repeat-associated core domain-containing protein [Candidatus Aminicenantes bacterium]
MELNLTRDTSGLITSLTGGKQLTVNYNQDLEITNVNHTIPQPFSESYTYDSRGNRLTSLTNSYTYNDLNQLTDSTTQTYTYDADGNLMQEKNKLSTEIKKYFYNSENRLIKYEHYATDVSPVDKIATYKYDIYGRRIWKTVNGTATNFLWDSDNLAVEMNGNYQAVRRYVTGVGKDDFEGYFECSEAWNPFNTDKTGWYSYVKDQVGTVYKVVSLERKQVIDNRTYDTFGNLVNQSGSSQGNLGFQSKYYDVESGLYYFYHRYYSPANGRFINEDPIGFNGGINMFAFVGNDPVNFIDIYGLDSLTDNQKVLHAMCCIWYHTYMDPPEKKAKELSFMAYEHKTEKDYILTACGQKEKSGRRKNVSTFTRKPGFNIIAWFHTHPPGASNDASAEDQNISTSLDITVYTIGDKFVTKWNKNLKKSRNERVMRTTALKGLCLSTKAEWEGKCCSKK